MPSLRRRISYTLAATALAAACGALGGYLLGRALTLKRAERDLKDYAIRTIASQNAGSLDSRAVLAAMNASPYEFCSWPEIAYFRELIFHSEFLKDAGRMRDGKVECSATLGRLNQPFPQREPDFSQPDGSKVYNKFVLFPPPEPKALALQLGESYVTYNVLPARDLNPAPIHFIGSGSNDPNLKSGRLTRPWPHASTTLLTRDGESRLDGNLSATRCSARYFNCVTGYMSVAEALRADRSQLTACVILGGLCGAFFGIVCSLLYRRNKSVEHQLRRAIARDKLRLVYQPIVELASGRIVGAEALARWTDEDGLAVSPEVFIRIAEERGFVGEITRLVVRQGLREFGETLRSRDDIRLSVNVTAADLSDPEFLPMLDQSLLRAGVAAQSVVIEITESSTARYKVAIETILRLRQRGHSVHIDDFGTGYSSLAYLHDLSIDAIKIDRSFTQAIGTESVTVGILPQILAMAAVLNLTVIVEGVETAEQAFYFAGMARPVFAQGWFFGRPVPAAEFLALLAGEEIEAIACTQVDWAEVAG